MTESSEYPTATTTPVVTATQSGQDSDAKPNRLYQAAAWVAIVAGTLFIVVVIFWAGFIVGKHSGGPEHFGRHMRGTGMLERQGPPMGPMHPHGPAWPGGPGPGPVGPGPAGPTQPPQTPPTR
jgi:hypothetical protein